MIPVTINAVSTWFIYLKRWLFNGSKKKMILFISLVAVWILILLYNSTVQLPFNRWSYLAQRISSYCNVPGPTISEEGSLRFFSSAQYRLRHVQMVVRHGDRAPMYHLPNVKYVPYDCKFQPPNSYHQKLLEDYLEIAPNFIVRRPRRSSMSRSVMPVLSDCGFMQLTSTGFLQHIYLGRHFKDVYGTLWGADNSLHTEDEFSIQTTDHSRTLQSGAAFLTGFLAPSYILTGRVAINMSRDTWFRERSDGIVTNCLDLKKLQHKTKHSELYRKGVENIEVLLRKFTHLLETPREKLPAITVITDSLLTNYCHNRPLPCGPQGCITPALVQEAILASDWAYVNNYTTLAEILIHPLLQKITQNILNRITHHNPQKFALFFAHETTITPLLMVLGGFDNRWPVYASRVVIELWHDDFSSDGGTAERGENEDTDTDVNHYYFRVLHNGQSFNEKLKICKKLTKPEKLCPVRDLLDYMKQDSPTMDMRYRKMCKNTS